MNVKHLMFLLQIFLIWLVLCDIMLQSEFSVIWLFDWNLVWHDNEKKVQLSYFTNQSTLGNIIKSVEFNSGYSRSIVRSFVPFSHVVNKKAGGGVGGLGVLPTLLVCCILIPDRHNSKKNLLYVCKTVFSFRYIRAKQSQIPAEILRVMSGLLPGALAC